jgi:hypothetical protein
MSDELEQFERRLKNQPLHQPPAEWRLEILSAAREAQPAANSSFLSPLHQRLVSLLWPHPVAWGGLAAVWILIVAAHVSLRDPVPVMAEKTPAPSPEAVAELQQQQHLLAELLGTYDVPAADRPKIFAPKPRSENLEMLSA